MNPRFLSTRGGAPAVGIETALSAGLAPDGGLYVAERIPQAVNFAAGDSLADTASRLLAPFFAGSSLESRLPALCADAFDFPAPLTPMQGADDHLLELFHGPTAAFKDYAARFLAGALAAMRAADAPTRTVLVATSGDTGAAVAAAFHRRPGFEVVILYPEGRVSPRQAHGLECWGENVRAYRVAGSFDDCQRLAKQALGDTELRAARALTSANSISLGRLLPQLAYHAHAALRFHAARGIKLNLIVPTGNLGNAGAAFLARAMGLPIGEIVLAVNANDALAKFADGAAYAPQPTLATLANAMDVGAPSNFERLTHWAGGEEALRRQLRAYSVDDAAIRTVIAAAPARHGIVPCPHTACGLRVLERLRQAGDTRPWAVAATAHPAKFEGIVEPLVGHAVAPPPALAAALARPAHGEQLANDYAALRALLAGAEKNFAERIDNDE
ncbi:threonine synthase [Lysobacter pythonis]|uniref:Threonine synthase n=1 Tax=Solilutibacter pythonis TaxID=2483112 RepID=A0A3M2HZM2_9GAMM|nr:threonine synthase [Lysobacter pythonis]RMH93100.1 threonine synthase [Lysobacter pythonis]